MEPLALTGELTRAIRESITEGREKDTLSMDQGSYTTCALTHAYKLTHTDMSCSYVHPPILQLTDKVMFT